MIYLDISDNNLIYYKDSQNFGFGFSYELINGESAIFTQCKELREKLEKEGYVVRSLSKMLNLPEDISLYNLFSYYFNGKVETDFDMIKAIFNGFFCERNVCYCLKLGNTFCWFKYSDERFIKLGTLQFSQKISKYSVGLFMKQLNYNIALTNVNINMIKYVTWGRDDIPYEFSNYIKNCIYLSDIFINIAGINGLSVLDTYRLLSNELLFNPILTAEKFVNALNENFKYLDFKMNFECNNSFYKDYSKMVCNSIDYDNCTFFLIIDCEGKKNLDGSLNNGLDKLGGLICCKYKNNIINLESFNCDEYLLDETLKIVFQKYRRYSKNKFNINIVVYGSSDEKMLVNSYNKLNRNKIKFIDCKSYITKYLIDNNIKIEGKASLSNIARTLYVAPIFPKHDPVNDSRTLFNILSKLLCMNDSFII